MNCRKRFVWGCLGLFLAVALPARAQTGCTASPNAAVQCFVRNAVYTGLVSLPPGMTMLQYKAYGVAVSNIVQTPSTLVFLLGTMSAVADAMPPTDADGVTPDQAAQDAAVDAIVDAALNDGLIPLPSNTTADQLKMFAHSVGNVMAQNNGVGVAPGALLRVLDSYLFSAVQADGTTDWSLVQTNLSGLVDGLVASGLVKLPSGVLPDNVKQFAFDLAAAIDNYKLATGRVSL